MTNNTKKRLCLISLMVVLLCLAETAYSTYAVEVYASARYPSMYHGIWQSVLIWTLGLLPALFLPLAVSRPSQVLLWSVYLMVYLPTAVVGKFSNQSFDDIIKMLLIMITGLAILGTVYKLPYLRLPRMHVSPRTFWLCLSCLIVFFLSIVWIELGSIIRIVSLEDIYIQRFALMDSGASTLAGYAQTWVPLIIMPLIMSFALWTRRWWLFILGTAGMLFFFAVSAQRIFLLGPILVVVIYRVFRDRGKHFAFRWVGGAIAIFLTPFVFPIVSNQNATLSYLIFDLVLNRSFFNSGVLSTWYFDFFSTNPRVHFADVRGINLFVSSPYTVSYKEELGWHFWGVRTDPNAHFMADGYAQLGYGGVLIECLVAAMLLWLLDSVCAQRKLPLRFVVTAIAMQVPNFMNAAIHTTMLGGGFLFALVLLYFLPALKEQPEQAPVALAANVRSLTIKDHSIIANEM